MIIGITGNIGSGKSTVAQLFKDAIIINVDKIAHKVLDNNCYKEVIKVFGSNILDDNLEINRKKLRDIVFNEPKKLEDLERITHPAILNRVESEIRMLDTKNNIIIIEGAVIDKIGLLGLVDKLIIVKCENLKERLDLDSEEIKRIIKLQYITTMETKANYFIDNSNSLEETEKQVEEILQSISQE
jgi:dephospho-CoA kinase